MTEITFRGTPVTTVGQLPEVGSAAPAFEVTGGDLKPLTNEAFAGKKQNIKVSLLDQRIVAGLGNIYVCEALYRARISPLVAAGSVSKSRPSRPNWPNPSVSRRAAAR